MNRPNFNLELVMGQLREENERQKKQIKILENRLKSKENEL